MTLEEFKKSINLRSIEKCCATCKYGFLNAVGDCFCRHPIIIEISDEAVLRRGISNSGYGWQMNVETNNVCDKWEAERS